ncbi:hypothetical protein RIF29_17204 [Crotalaria pallida]|uniref:Uncharacterized protein n=1 Tax=Crotalaria pallida TaxID=3830 RepID=A0AAN9FGP7_CROPI
MIHRTCVEDMNSDCEVYNENLAKPLLEIQAMLPGSRSDLFMQIYIIHCSTLSINLKNLRSRILRPKRHVAPSPALKHSDALGRRPKLPRLQPLSKLRSSSAAKAYKALRRRKMPTPLISHPDSSPQVGSGIYATISNSIVDSHIKTCSRLHYRPGESIPQRLWVTSKLLGITYEGNEEDMVRRIEEMEKRDNNSPFDLPGSQGAHTGSHQSQTATTEWFMDVLGGFQCN